MPRARAARELLLAAALAAAGCGAAPGSEPSTTSAGPVSGSCAGPVVAGTPNLTLQRVASGLSSPLDLQAAPGDRSRLYVVEQAGRIRVLRDGVPAATFLDIVARVSSGGERGLLGLAFHPQFATSSRFFVNYTDRAGDTHIAEFRATSPDAADAGSERELLFVRQPFANHNGGGLAFGNDGLLYVALGDGGSGGDPMNNGQSLATPLGKILRLDVDRGSPFAVPSDNPFLNTPGAFAPVWAFGLRNPWRLAFDRASGDLYIGDVGQNLVEEVDVGLAARRGGENYGWARMEGSRCFGTSTCSTAGLTLPVAEYDHGTGCSITGGFVYRGCRMPGYQGTYFYGDYCSRIVRSFRLQNGVATEARDWTSSLSAGVDALSSFGVDADGEGYIVDHGGEVYRIVPVG